MSTLSFYTIADASLLRVNLCCHIRYFRLYPIGRIEESGANIYAPGAFLERVAMDSTILADPDTFELYSD